MPGTYGSAAASLLLFLVYLAYDHVGLLSSHPSIWPITLIAGLVLLSILSVALAPWAIAYFGREDPGPFVLDEAAAICLTMLFLPLRPGWHELIPIALGFGAFRLFDIWKPPPVRQIEELPRGWGILLDDLAAAVYANILCQLVLRLILKRWM
jgi:phosphatidylglycerophosphatase A